MEKKIWYMLNSCLWGKKGKYIDIDCIFYFFSFLYEKLQPHIKKYYNILHYSHNLEVIIIHILPYSCSILKQFPDITALHL